MYLVRAILHWLLFWILPQRTKRLVMVASLIAFVGDRHELSDDLMQRINEDFQLCSVHTAMLIPIYANVLIWRSLRDVAVDRSQIWLQREVIVSAIPKWMRYGTAQIHKDLKMLSANPTLIPAV